MMGRVLPQGQPGVDGVGMAAIIRHFRSAGQGPCLFGISEKTTCWAQLPHLRPSFAENKFNRVEKNSGSEHISDFVGVQRICDCQAQITAALPGKRPICLIAEQFPKKVL
jgi:hypothetical protein